MRSLSYGDANRSVSPFLCSPANAEAAQLYRENMKEYIRRVKATVEESWLDPEEKDAMEEVEEDGQQAH